MSNAGREFVGKTKDIFLAEPLTRKGRMVLVNMKMDMTEDEFYEKIYVNPFSVYEKKNENEIDNINQVDSDVDQNSYQDIIDLNVLKNRMCDFENSVKKLNDALFIIKGVAGSGKTTYLHHLLRDMDEIEAHIYNFEDVRQANAFMAVDFDLEDLYKDNVYKFLSILLMEISKILGKGEKSTFEHHELIKRITSIYINNFQVTEEILPKTNLLETNVDIRAQQELFKILQQYAENKLSYKELSNNLITKIMMRLHSNQTNNVSDLSYVAGFVIRLYFCVFKITSKKQLYVVDNIETFVQYDENSPIQQCELENIVQGCYEAAIRMREILSPIQKIKGYDTFYGFLVVTRETTASTALCDLEHYNDLKKENEVDISEWFCTQEIFDNKKRFCTERGISLKDNCYYDCYQSILSDYSAYRWGLNGIVSKMYKHSHRRNVECVPEAISVIPEQEIEYFNSLWEIAKNRDIYKSSLKALCRKYILRKLLDNVQRKEYFDKLMVENLDLKHSDRNLEHREKILSCKSHKCESNSYARKIATILHRYALDNGDNKYVSFPRIIFSVLKQPYMPNKVNETQIRNLGKILFLMNETRNENTNWTSLVCIKYDSTEIYNEERLCQILCEEWKKYKDNKISIDDATKFGVKITEAGSLFSKLLADFEYFACRFLTKEPPLFSKENIKMMYINGKKSFRCVEIIHIVREKAFSCIDEIIEKDFDFFSNPENHINQPPNFKAMYENEYSWIYKDSINAKSLVHPYRILTHHSGYLSNYIDYVKSYIPESEFETPDDKELLIDKLKDQLSQYNHKLNDLLCTYPQYFARRC